MKFIIYILSLFSLFHATTSTQVIPIVPAAVVVSTATTSPVTKVAIPIKKITPIKNVISVSPAIVSMPTSTTPIPSPAVIQQPPTPPKTVTLSLDLYNPQSSTVNSMENVPVLMFDTISSENDLFPRTISVNIQNEGQGTVNDAYLYISANSYFSGMENVPTAMTVVSNGVAIFTIPQDKIDVMSFSIKNFFTVKVDVSGLNNQNDSEAISASVNNAVFIDSTGNTINATGNAIGNVITVIKSTSTQEEKCPTGGCA